MNGSLPKETYDRLFNSLSLIPLPATFSGKGIHAEELLSSLFPKNYEKFPLKGNLDFSFKAKKTRHGGISIIVNVSLQPPKADSSSLRAEKLNIHCDITLFPQSREAKGNLKCEISSPSIKLGTHILIITATTLYGTLNNRDYTFKTDLKQLICPTLKLGKDTFRDLRVGALSLLPKSFDLHSLSFLCQGSKLKLDHLQLDLSSLNIKAIGELKTDLPVIIQKIPRIKRIRGNIHYTLQGCLHPSSPALTGKFEAREIKVQTTDGVIGINDLKVRAKLIGNRLTVSEARFIDKNALLFQGSASFENISNPLGNLRSTFELTVRDVGKLQPLMEVLAPSISLPSQYSGPLRLKVDVKTNKKKMAFQGSIHFNGEVHDASLPMTCKGISFSIPFHIEMTRDGEPQPRSTESQQTQSGFIHIQTIGFGVVTIDDLKCALTSTRNRITANDISFELFQGHAAGKGYVGLLSPYPWKITMKINNISLKDVCNHIPGFQDALSGRVITALTLMGNKGKLSSMRGSFTAKTVESREEPRRISQEFIRRLTGKKGRFFFLQKYRPYNKGIIEAKIERGIIFFKTLEISHKFLGFKDLSIAVSRLSNKISIKDIVWEILQVSKTNVGQPVIKTK